MYIKNSKGPEHSPVEFH